MNGTSDTIEPRDGDPGRAAVPRMLEVGAAWGWRFIVVVAAVFATAWLLVQLSVVLIPVFVALILAALLNPLVDLVDRWMPRLLAVWLVLLSVVAALSLIVYLLQAQVRDAVEELQDSWGSARADIEDWFRTGPLGLEQSRIDSLSERAETALREFASGVFTSSDSARIAVEVVGGFFLTIVLTFFFAKDGAKMWRWLVEKVHPVRRSALDRSGVAAFKALQGWIRGVAITGVVDGLLIGIALVVLGVEAAIPLAVITFFAAFLPIIGATLAGALAAAVALATQGPETAIIVVLVVLAVQQIEGDILLPIVMYRQVALHPVVVLLALAVGAAVGGILGAVIAVPLTAAAAAAIAAARKDADLDPELEPDEPDPDGSDNQLATAD